MTEALFTPFTLGDIAVRNRVVMAPLTRNRAKAEDDTPFDIHAEYYAQRAGAGLIITEGTQISPEGKGYAWTPGIYSAAQVAGWKRVTDAVHAKGGKIAAQLWHVGRISHTSLQLGGAAPVAPSAIGAGSKTFDGKGFVETSVPRALDLAEIPRVIEDYRRAARNAAAAGFDGVEIHAANGYLIDQFLRDGANHRDDASGGSIDHRTRLLAEVTAAACAEIGRDRVGVRLAPAGPINDCADSDPQPLFELAMDKLDAIGPVYVHMVEGVTGQTRDSSPALDYAALRRRFSGTYMANNCLDAASAQALLDQGRADLVSFGRAFISNPDLVRRLRIGATLNEIDRATLYGGDARGYVDYPALAE